jgi:diguanylate cyclase (GGDEF)-like protein/PAS domain S-box-containing protein
MTDRTELMEAALDGLPEGIALLGVEGDLKFWNQAAEAITGYARMELLSRAIPVGLEALLQDWMQHSDLQGQLGAAPERGRGSLVHARHKLGHTFQAIARRMVLRDGLSKRMGAAVLFHPAESLEALPHGELGEGENVEESQADLEDRLQMEFEDCARGGSPLGVLWITVDQAQGLRKTHGNRACEAMLEKVERALAQGLRPAEELGRWGEDEFLIITHERTPEMLAAHAQALTGQARTADFRWWGDRVSLTVSIGAAQADAAETLIQLLERAQAAMVSSIHAGGNHVTPAPGGQACLPS